MSDIETSIEPTRTIEDYHQSSMLYWWPKLKNLNIPMPRTMIMNIPEDERLKIIKILYGEKSDTNSIDNAILSFARASRFTYPLFLRTDQSSGKHSWKSTCFISNESKLLFQAYQLIDANENADILGLPWKALVFREFIEMDSRFVAFHGDLPISPERRYFVKDGQVLCHHPYWPESAMHFHKDLSGNSDEPKGWRDALKEINIETPEEIALLSDYAIQISNCLEGEWSVDFCRGKNKTWYFIDSALSFMSYHPECY